MTLTEMLREIDPMADVRVGLYKEVFKDWLKGVGLPEIGFQYYNFNITESLRKLLITLVDEP